MQEAAPCKENAYFGLVPISRVNGFPLKNICLSHPNGGMERRYTIRRICYPFLNNAGGVDDPRHIPIRVLHCEEAFVERAVVVGVSVSEEAVVDVALAPDELAVGVGAAWRGA